MIVSTPEIKYTVEDYDFTFLSGMMLPITLNESLGDSLVHSDTVVQIRLVSKPSMNDPAITLPAEDITVFKTQLATIQHRTREVTALNPEQQLEWAKTLKDVSKTIQ